MASLRRHDLADLNHRRRPLRRRHGLADLNHVVSVAATTSPTSTSSSCCWSSSPTLLFVEP
jgi:hypothetical protein